MLCLQVTLLSLGCVRAHSRGKAWKDNYAQHISTHKAKPGGERKPALIACGVGVGGGTPNYKAGLEPPHEIRASTTHPAGSGSRQHGHGVCQQTDADAERSRWIAVPFAVMEMPLATLIPHLLCYCC